MVPAGAAPWAWPFPWPEELLGRWCRDGWAPWVSGGAGSCVGLCCGHGAGSHGGTGLVSAWGHFVSTFTSVGAVVPRRRVTSQAGAEGGDTCCVRARVARHQGHTGTRLPISPARSGRAWGRSSGSRARDSRGTVLPRPRPLLRPTEVLLAEVKTHLIPGCCFSFNGIYIMF